MSDRILEELFSACFDGEITPEERARVDALLASDPQVRKSLEECRKLSGLLKELPTPSAPVEFSAAVMQSIERQMLLGPAAGETSIPAPQTPRRRARWASAAVVMSAAAVVLVAVVVGRLQGPMPEGQLAGTREMQDFDSARGPELARNESPIDAPAKLAGRDSRGPAMRSFSPLPASAAAPSAPSASMELGAAPSESGVATVNNGQSRLVFNDLKNLKSADVGEVVEAIEHNGGRVAVVRCTVLDRMDGVRGFQTLLARNSISEALPQAETRALKEQDHLPIEGKQEVTVHSPGDDELIGVFVEAPRAQIAEVLRQIQSLEVEELAVDEPVELTQLNSQFESEAAPPEPGVEKFGEAAADKKKADDSAPLAKTDDKESKVAGSAPERPEAAAKPAKDSSQKIATDDKAMRRNLNRNSQVARQRQMNLPSQFFQADQRARNAIGGGSEDTSEREGELANTEMKRPVVAARPDLPAAEGKLKPGAPAERPLSMTNAADVSADETNVAPVQVLFLFVDKRGQSPAVPAKPAAPIKAKVRGENAVPSKNDGAAS